MGELVHGIESRIIQATRHGAAPASAFLDDLDVFFDRALTMIDDLVRIDRGEAVAEEEPSAAARSDAGSELGALAEIQPGASLPVLPSVAQVADAVALAELAETAELAELTESAGQRAQLRVRAELVDQLINESGEMAIARSRIEGEMRTVKTALLDLTENVIRLRQQLREIEIQAETQMQSQMSQIQETHQDFDPLEMDRFTRFQELTRMMAESVNDVTTVQHNLLRNVDNTSTALAAQARLNRELSQSLMGVRMVPFNSIIDRLYRVVRQAAKDLDKRVNLDVREGQLEIDRSVLEKMIGPIEHLLRNCIAHGIETREARRATGKEDIGEIVISLAQQGNEIVIELADDGAGLNYERIRAKAIENGLLTADQPVDERQLTQFIFASGFSTAAQVSEVAGRGVGMDVVKTEAIRLGGHIEVHSQSGQGTRFRIFLPLTLAVTQALLVRSGNRIVALPSSMVEQVMELRPEAAEAIRTAGGTDWLDVRYPWFYLANLLDEGGTLPPPARRHWILLLKGADRYVALEVDGLLGNQEIVVKNIGPQLARVPGITGATVLNDGQIALILNPLTLASRATQLSPDTLLAAAPVTEQVIPTIMVVDDSLTVRKIVSRLLTREGYQVVTAKDGVDALEQLLEIVPAAMLVDIEMPRMDGFELTRNVRAQERLKNIPVIMITSRIADKHRNYAQEIGVNEYLGKPYDEEVLLGKLRGFVEQQGMVVPKVA
jgi:chemosensory pili system protein ChpA (sensor histidine kinase/response regulator)